MNVYWLEQCVADVPVENDWLSARDVASLNAMRFEKRRSDWRLGRWTAKLALASYMHRPADAQSLAEIEIRPAASGAPEVVLVGIAADVSISISHSAGTALCAITESDEALANDVGCDLETVEPRSDAFAADYFTIPEQEWIACADLADRAALLALLWSAKESVLKTLRIGLRMDTRCLTVTPMSSVEFDASDTWRPLQVRLGSDRIFQGWWRYEDRLIRTITALSPPREPIPLEVPNCAQAGYGEPTRNRVQLRAPCAPITSDCSMSAVLDGPERNKPNPGRSICTRS
jgi:4'-phosphopantetheinyl transferase